MAGTFTSVYRCEISLPIRGRHAMYCTCPTRARRGESDKLLPALQTLSIEKPLVFASKVVKEAIEQFVAARQLAGRPIGVSLWD